MTLDELKIKISEYFAGKPVKRVFVFGSFLEKGDAANDIDLIAEFDYEASPRPGFFDRMDWQTDLMNLFQKKVDLLSAGGISPFIVENINSTKKLVYERKG